MQIFISYAFDDREIMEVMRRSLKKAGVSAYTAEHDLQLGKSVSKKIQNEIKNSDAVIAIITRDHPSLSVNQEVGCATTLHIPVIPLVEEGANTGFILGDIEQIRFTKSNVVGACEKISNKISKQIDKSQSKEKYKELENIRKIIENYEVYSYELEEGVTLTGKIESDIPIHVFIVNTRNLNLFENEEEFNYEKGIEDVLRYSINFQIPKTGNWHIIIDNESEEEDEEDIAAEVDIKIGVKYN